MSDPSASTSAATGDGATVVFKKKSRGPRSLRKPDAATQPANHTTDDATAGLPSSSRQPSRSSGIRGQGDSDEDEEDGADSAVVVKAKRKAHNPLLQSTLPSYKRLKQSDAEDDYDLDLDDEDGGLGGYLANRGRHTDRFGETGVSTRSKAVGGAADGLSKVREDATRHNNWDLEVDDDGKAIHATAAASSTGGTASKATNDDGVYRGAKGYSSFLPTRDDGTSSKMRSRGPIRTTTNVRSVTVMDYQPDICKDYKETGYCGFGDTCKFLHDRSDYLAGWELDLLPNSAARGREDFLSDPEGEDSDGDDVPFACLICRQAFTDPVVTNCGHYFCSACAIKRYTKTSKCFACGAQTGGLFNSATKVLKRMEDAKKRKQSERSERRRNRGYDDDGEDEEAAREILEGVEVGGAGEDGVEE